MDSKRMGIITCILIAAALYSGFSAPAFAGSLEPTDKPGPTMKTLDEVEPRIPVSQADIPLSITAPGSYYLTENIVYKATAGHAVSIDCDDVELDLRGFTITGSDTARVNGITAWARHNVEIRNGTIRNFDVGISESAAGSDYRIVNVRSLSNLRRGISLYGSGNKIADCVVSDAEEFGIYCGESSSVIGCRAVACVGQGIRVLDNGTVRDSVAIGCGRQGIQVGSSSIVSGCVVKTSGYRGIQGGDTCRITDNTCKDNTDVGIYTGQACVISGNSVSGSTVHGIAVTYGCTISNNTAYNNGDTGIHGGDSSTIVDNTVYGNQNYGIAGNMGCIVNRNTVRNNRNHGIWVEHNCTVTWNNCYNNGLDGFGAGIRAASGNRIESNQLTENDMAIRLDSDFNIVVKNTARANTILVSQLSSGNRIAAWSTDPANANPWSNFLMD